MSFDARYSRQIRFHGFGDHGQARLGSARVLIVGLGALGCGLADTLARAGVGTLLLVDRDIVEPSNLQRQVLYDEADATAGRPKAQAAAARLGAINAEVEPVPIAEDFTPAVFEALDPRPDLILDGTDNFATRYLINDLALRHDIPWIYGGAVGAHGTAMVVRPRLTPCLRCVLPSPPASGESPTCETTGVLLPAVQAVTAFQAAEAIKLLIGAHDVVTRGIVMFDAWQHRHEVLLRAATPSPHCATCRGDSFPALDQDWSSAVTLCGRDAVQVQPRGAGQVDLARLADHLAATVTDLEVMPGLLRFEVEDHRFSVFEGGRALIFGTGDTTRARILYDRYVGG